MRKMDEMERSIRVRSESLGYKFFLVVLAVWTIVELTMHLVNGNSYNYIPSILLIAGLLVEGFYEESMKRRMVAGDEEYQEPSRTAQIVVTALGVALVTFVVGFITLYVG